MSEDRPKYEVKETVMMDIEPDPEDMKRDAEVRGEDLDADTAAADEREMNETDPEIPEVNQIPEALNAHYGVTDDGVVVQVELNAYDILDKDSQEIVTLDFHNGILLSVLRVCLNRLRAINAPTTAVNHLNSCLHDLCKDIKDNQ